MCDSLVQALETSTMTTDRTGNKERAHGKDGESHATHATHDSAAAQDHASRELQEGEALEENETSAAEAENRTKNGQERDDKKVSSTQIILVLHATSVRHVTARRFFAFSSKALLKARVRRLACFVFVF